MEKSINNEQHSSLRDRLFSKDCARFKRYIEGSTAHGVVHIFIGKSRIRRAIWLLIVLACGSGCLYTCIDRIRYLASGPTATTISLHREQEIAFPAVTICNLNMLRFDYLDKLDLAKTVQAVLIDTEEGLDACIHDLNNISKGLPNITYQRFFEEGKHELESFIIGCSYLGRNCSIDSSTFVPILTRIGVCYTFNGGHGEQQILTTSGTGAKLGLRLLVNVSQHEYAASPNLDAGVKIAIHRQSEPPEPDDQGIAVPTGTNAFININQQNVIDETGTSCNTEVSGFKFLQHQFNYSAAACANDCFYTQIARACNCTLSDKYSPDSESFMSLPLCYIKDMCCVLAQQTTAVSCHCLPSCNTTFYKLTSTFPAKFFETEKLADEGHNLLAANIFYESLSINEQVTASSYDVVSLLSEIGGQLGLFMGISIISLVEFLFWVLDEVKDRCFGVSERQLKGLLKNKLGNSNSTLMTSSVSIMACQLSRVVSRFNFYF